jgi:hypothetical protein
MSLITAKLLSNEAFVFDSEIIKLLQPEKRAAYNPNEDPNDDPKLHEMVLGIQENVLRHILSPSVMLRLSDSSKYGNEYSPAEVLQDIQNGIFVSNEPPNSFKRNLQSSYIDGLLTALESEYYDEISKAAIYRSIIEIEKFTKRPFGDSVVKDHLKYLNWKINKALEN